MKSSIYILCYFFLLLFAFKTGKAQDVPQVYIGEGTEVSAQKLHLSLKGLSLMDHGNFIQDSSTIRFHAGEGKEHQVIHSKATFYKIDLDLAGKVLSLDTDLRVEERILLASGSLNLNTHTLMLESTQSNISGENDNRRVLGEGVVEKITNLSFPASVDPGNIGMEISADADLGLSKIRRIHRITQTDSFPLVHRQYELLPSIKAEVPISIRIDYHRIENPFNWNQELMPIFEKQEQWGPLSYFTNQSQDNSMNIILPPVQKDWHIGLTTSGAKSQRGPSILDLGPNPFSDRLKINWKGREDRAVSAKIYGSGGALVYSKSLVGYGSSISLNQLEDLAVGMYILKIETDSGMILSQTLLKGPHE
ncbi:MAG: T9SS type A sorting domain-containing protein [Bacteroidota bacterium]